MTGKYDVVGGSAVHRIARSQISLDSTEKNRDNYLAR